MFIPKDKEIYEVFYREDKRRMMDNRFSGHDMPELKLVQKLGDVVIYKQPGHSSWYCRGGAKYYPPTLYIGILEDDIYTIKADIVYTRKHAKQAKEEALRIATKLSNGKTLLS